MAFVEPPEYNYAKKNKNGFSFSFLLRLKLCWTLHISFFLSLTHTTPTHTGSQFEAAMSRVTAGLPRPLPDTLLMCLCLWF